MGNQPRADRRLGRGHFLCPSAEPYRRSAALRAEAVGEVGGWPGMRLRQLTTTTATDFGRDTPRCLHAAQRHRRLLPLDSGGQKAQELINPATNGLLERQLPPMPRQLTRSTRYK